MKRSSGVLMHVTSLPSAFGIGDIGPTSFKFADTISESGQSYWQMLPVNPSGAGNSPYQPRSVFAGNPLLISPDVLRREKLVSELPEEMERQSSTNRVRFDRVIASKETMLQTAYEAFRLDGDKSEFEEFVAANSKWLDDYSLYSALKKENNDLPWYEWPKEIRDRDTRALSEKRTKLEGLVNQEEFIQFEFFRQWESLKATAPRLEYSLWAMFHSTLPTTAAISGQTGRSLSCEATESPSLLAASLQITSAKLASCGGTRSMIG
jgi:4-alpha-glucanotransferase